MAAFACGRHTAEIRARGGISVIGAAEPLLRVRYNRIRDDISHAEIELPADCCDLMADVRTVKHELHIFRDGEPVWEGPITRIEYEFDSVQIFAEDILWVAKRSIVEGGYDHGHPNIGNVIDDMHWLLIAECFDRYDDPWNMTAVGADPIEHLHPIHNDDPANDPREARVVFPFSVTVWEDFDKYAEDYGADYTVVNRDIYYWDVNLAWNVIPDLDEQFISEYPRLVEYGAQLVTRQAVTNGKGYAAVAVADDVWLNEYSYIDNLISNVSESATTDGPPDPEDLATWRDTAQRNLLGAQPSPLSIVIPANTTLLPGSPWNMGHLFPGAWFRISVERLCRTVTEWQRLQEIVVEETAPGGEVIQFSAVAAPSVAVFPAPVPKGSGFVTQYVFESQTVPKEFGAVFYGTGDEFGRTIELQWSGADSTPGVLERLAIMDENFGPRVGILLTGVKNNRLTGPHTPADIVDPLKPGGWSNADFAPL